MRRLPDKYGDIWPSPYIYGHCRLLEGRQGILSTINIAGLLLLAFSSVVIHKQDKNAKAKEKT